MNINNGDRNGCSTMHFKSVRKQPIKSKWAIFEDIASPLNIYIYKNIPVLKCEVNAMFSDT